ncbi:hypothetical protein [Mesorhizobium sp. KR9-304]|uniref:hypothetical protein n=1 Tax=Mesorhizobium sp. KR9-304 TaxID=3156614 RepID=UPI0032B330AD
MTGIVVLLYIAIGIGCGLIRLSAIAVGIIALVPAVVGAFAVSEGGGLSILGAILIPLLVIEAVYFVTMLVLGRMQDTKPAAEQTDVREARPGFPRKPQIREEP